MKNKIKRLHQNTNDIINKNAAMKKLAMGMTSVIKQSTDCITFEQILVENKINNLIDFIKIKGIYHYEKTFYFRDQRLKIKHPAYYQSEMIELKWSDHAHYILRALVVLVRYGRIDTLHIRALYRKRSPDEIIKVQKDIKMVFDNTFIIEQISQDILRHFSIETLVMVYGSWIIITRNWDLTWMMFILNAQQPKSKETMQLCFNFFFNVVCFEP